MNSILNYASLFRYQDLEKIERGELSIEDIFPLAFVYTGVMYLNPESFCRKCHTLWVKDRYCTNCGEKKK
ncbi:MAG: hypothetical protein L0H53_03840 [Candidatus Nitrosocosmicus sp.]|nr:hypothetical protein [Candidatus Nitrosocosmicus sp.]MDN5866242.1 hypothetical protein [Candidatus Nitrosocosmicus sp.]